MGKLIPNAFNLGVVIFVALGSTAGGSGSVGGLDLDRLLDLVDGSDPALPKGALEVLNQALDLDRRRFAHCVWSIATS